MTQRDTPPEGSLQDFDGRLRLRDLAQEVAEINGRDFFEVLSFLIEAQEREKNPDRDSKGSVELEMRLHGGDLLSKTIELASKFLGVELKPWKSLLGPLPSEFDHWFGGCSDDEDEVWANLNQNYFHLKP